MDENNITSSEESTTETTNTDDNKSSAAKTYYSAPDPTPQNELDSWSKTETENKPNTAVSYHSEPVYSSNQGAEETFSTGFAIASLIFGILSILGSCCCIGGLFSILGIVFGCLQKKDESDKKPGMAIAGIITSIIGLLFSLIALIYIIGMSYISAGNTVLY